MEMHFFKDIKYEKVELREPYFLKLKLDSIWVPTLLSGGNYHYL